jgi:hypothetical protein
VAFSTRKAIQAQDGIADMEKKVIDTAWTIPISSRPYHYNRALPGRPGE